VARTKVAIALGAATAVVGGVLLVKSRLADGAPSGTSVTEAMTVSSDRTSAFDSFVEFARADLLSAFGLSSELSEWQACGKRGLRARVESRKFLEHLFNARRRLRLLWLNCRDAPALAEHGIRELSADTGIRFSQFVEALRAPHFGLLLERTKFYETSRKQWPDRVRLAPLTYAPLPRLRPSAPPSPPVYAACYPRAAQRPTLHPAPAAH